MGVREKLKVCTGMCLDAYDQYSVFHSSTPADSPQSETVSRDHVKGNILSQKVYGEFVVICVTCEECK